ncbi:tRNA lysidine(34) synthetase TilS [Helicobacter sp. MIT 11-5569]|uniref:tRNA lysidine(34) synthetase TilS n=1 Tax=Helicobacter sp. MIT 11-5569 TaxID=1548151 RepID=UPI00051FD924|nr:tRNA lysidine(34) synthetase TilS [Helicobacter sp. MIT 11-5569]TLD85327.1 tRNA lysidine(34) synthetase TilS [Helicobacter sp. MIT 11-5569]
MDYLEIQLEFLDALRGSRNLLAFSSGVDSSALYFLLKFYGIPFDVAIVDYGVRKQSKLEVERAKTLCFLDKKQCFIKQAEPIFTDFEHTARKIRYEFFEQILHTYHYQNLILAHQLNDAFEWFLMQFCKGTSGALLQMQGCYKKQSAFGDYFIVRPLIKTSRKEILEFLHNFKIFYFEDFSNTNTNFQRNAFRKHFSNPLLERFRSGIAFSLGHFKSEIADVKLFRIPPLEPFCVFKEESHLLERIDRACKMCGILLSRGQKLELKGYLEREEFSVVLQGKINIEKLDCKIFISRFCAYQATIPKQFKEKYRKLRIPKKFRIFLENARKLGKLEAVLSEIKEI